MEYRNVEDERNNVIGGLLYHGPTIMCFDRWNFWLYTPLRIGQARVRLGKRGSTHCPRGGKNDEKNRGEAYQPVVMKWSMSLGKILANHPDLIL